MEESVQHRVTPAASVEAKNDAVRAQKMLSWALTEKLEPRGDLREDLVILEDFQILETLGKGGMGTVYKAVQRGLNRVVALKVFFLREKDNALFIARVQREGKLMALLEHPNVLKIYDAAVTEEGYPYLVLEHVDGKDLATILKERKRLSIKEAVQIAIKVCDALSAVHALGIVHRDIKPGNILVGNNHQVKVMDFGISKNVRKENATALTMTGTTVGTVDYMSPEQTRNEELGPKSDLYAVGALLYEMITGVTPRGKFAPLTKFGASKRLEYIVMRCLQHDKNKRPVSAQSLATMLQNGYSHQRNSSKLAKVQPLIYAALAGIFAIMLVVSLSISRDQYANTSGSPAESKAEVLDVEFNKPLALLESPYTTVSGLWWLENGMLCSQEEPHACRMFMSNAGYSYLFKMQFQRVRGRKSFYVFLPTIKGLGTLELGNDGLSGLANVDGKGLPKQAASQVVSGLNIENGKFYDLELEVREETITLSLNGSKVKTWKVKGQLAVPAQWGQLPFNLGLGSDAQMLFQNPSVVRLHSEKE